MADDIIQFSPGGKVTAEETNANNLLLKEWALDNSESEAYIDNKFTTLSNNLNNQISAINTQIGTINSSISSLQNALNSISYTEKAATVGIGTTQMNSYLPQDDGRYLVWVEGYRGATGTTDSLYVSTDLQTTERRVYQLDGDGGRSSRGLAYFIVPTTSAGWIKFSGNADYIYLVGYCKI